MGTRADFYTEDKETGEYTWRGSIAWDGYPDGIDKNVLESNTEEYFLSSLDIFLKKDESATFPEDGWPWPWQNSETTDYAYVFRKNKVWASRFGSSFFDPLLPESDDPSFPNFDTSTAVRAGSKKSGVMVLRK